MIANITDKCPINNNKVTEKESQGTYDFRYNSANKIIFVRWNENSLVTFASNCLSVNPVGPSKFITEVNAKLLMSLKSH